MRGKLIFIGVLFLCCQHSVFSQLTLEQCQEKARTNYPLIKRFDLVEQTREYTVSNAGKNFLPQLDITIIGGVIDGLPTFTLPGQSESSGTEFNMISIIQLNQAIWDGGITKASKQVTTAGAEIEVADLDVQLYKIEDRVNNLFFGVLLINEQIEQLRLLKSQLDRNLKRVEIAVENGTAYRSDIDEIRVEMLNTDQKVTELSYNKEAYITVLEAMIGEQVSRNAEFIRPVALESLNSFTINRPELRLFENQRNLFEAQSRIKKSMMYPKVGVTGFGVFIEPGVAFGTSDLNRVLVGGLSLNWNIGGLYTNSNEKNLTRLNIEKVDNQQEVFMFNTNLELTQTGREIQKYDALIKRDQEILALKNSIKKSYQTKYDNGISTLSELLDRTNDENVARQTLITHEIQYLMAAYKYKNRSGN